MRDCSIVGALLIIHCLVAAKLSDAGAIHPPAAHADTVDPKGHGTHLREPDKKLIHKDFKPVEK